jgi:predicted AlkP superfamily phosphohydrolase/phosphomutase
MRARRVLAIGLDGLEETFADRLMAAGEMPALAELRKRSACFRLDHGAAQRTGLAWEHFASGLSPEAAQRWAAIEFDPATYRTWQEGARFVPWWTALDRRVVVFDTPYVDFRKAPGTKGIIGWGAHDPGTATAGRPHGLLREFLGRFGRYPSEWTYKTPWPSAAYARTMGDVLSRAVDTRTRAAQWLARERLPEWDAFIAITGEAHGSVEGLWHGVDPDHPLYKHSSAQAAGGALLDVHRALDRMIAALVRSAGDAAIVAFTMGGMGANHSDVPSMVLLPELLYRHELGRQLLTVPARWRESPSEVPILDEDDDWVARGRSWVPQRGAKQSALERMARSLVKDWPVLRAGLKGIRATVRSFRGASAPVTLPLDWQPAQHYQEYWPRMRAFALPSYYDGRIRINLRGRERDGVVAASQYDRICEEIATLLNECRNPRTAEPVVAFIERPSAGDPMRIGGSQGDLIVVWRGVVTAFEHPDLGLIGPVPIRRTGGHTGRYGMAYIATTEVRVGDLGVRSSFDVAPTIAELLGCPPIPSMSGTSLLKPR